MTEAMIKHLKSIKKYDEFMAIAGKYANKAAIKKAWKKVTRVPQPQTTMVSTWFRKFKKSRAGISYAYYEQGLKPKEV